MLDLPTVLEISFHPDRDKNQSLRHGIKGMKKALIQYCETQFYHNRKNRVEKTLLYMDC